MQDIEALGELNKVYNFQDTIILCEIFEQRSCRLQEIYKDIQENVILLVLSVGAFKGKKVSVA